MDIDTSLKKLFSLHKFGIKLGLENTIGFLNHLGNPQQKLKTIHIAGSNGKGSTSSFIASILQEYEYKIGLYTSPHFVKFNERVVINGKQIEDEYIATFVSDNENYIDEHQLTFFEVTTALAFKYFKDMNTDFCIIETGLGGRLDSTNVLNPLATVITSISLEHTNVLGNTIEQIAAEKAAIIKNNSKVFIGMIQESAADVIKQKCFESESVLYPLKDFIEIENDKVRLLVKKDKLMDINPPLKGKYQKFNAALAALTLSNTFSFFDEDKYSLGISNVAGNTGLQGRYEYFHFNPTIIFDSAHNPEGVENFLSEYSREAGLYNKRTLLFGAMRDKAIGEMLQMLSAYFDEILISEIQYERSAKVEEIIEICRRLNIHSTPVSEPAEFITNFIKRDAKECLVVLGSMYLLGEIKQHLPLKVT
ncbi:MAG: bifunctional folylpolyglutamate synthase/dihydrofolate synthase [Ignavibacteriaceae bacterium]|nr:bifunctional folylpolyglutamate synthase/dihydrofolate synthase [Ignavibacteriaceae bacterium]